MGPIVAGYEGSPSGRAALRLAQDLSGLLGAPLIVASAYPEHFSDGVLSTAYDRGSLEWASQILDEARSGRFARSGVEYRAVSGPSPAKALHDLALERGAELIVVGPPRVEIHSAVGPQSTAEQVIQHSPCRVVVARGEEPRRLERIGVAVDGSDPSRVAVATARALAEAGPDTVRYVDLILIEPERDGYHLEPSDPGLFVKGPSQAAQWLERASRLAMGRAAVRRIRHDGDATQELLRISTGLDLLIAGSRDHGPLGRLLLGSVSTQLVRHAQCPVMVVPRTAARRAAAVV